MHLLLIFRNESLQASSRDVPWQFNKHLGSAASVSFFAVRRSADGLRVAVFYAGNTYVFVISE
jgi:hypothetical protein